MAKGSTGYKILHDQYGDSIQYNYGDNAVNNLRDNEFRGKNRNETNLEYKTMLSGLGIIAKSVGNLYQSKYDADETGTAAHKGTGNADIDKFLTIALDERGVTESSTTFQIYIQWSRL